MSITQSSHRLLSWPLAFAAVLGLAVLLFGTAYKLLQYSTQGCAFKAMPAAKLLTEKERPVREYRSESTAAQPAFQAAFLSLAALLLAVITRKFTWQHFKAKFLDPNENSRCKRNPACVYFCFRPPPSYSPA